MENLCKKLEEAKTKESMAKKERIAIEQQLIEEFKPSKLEGSEFKMAGNFKIAVTSKLTRKLNYEAYQKLELPSNMGFVDLKPAINLKHLRMVERIDPDITGKCITVKPAKPSIKIQEVSE